MNDLVQEIRKEELLGELLLFSLLGRIIYMEPNQAWFNSLIKDDVFSDVPFSVEQTETIQGLELLKAWSARNAGGISTEEFTLLKREYVKLFVGLEHLDTPLWESAYSEKHLLFQERTIRVRNWYARFGLEVERLNQEPDDHLGLEMLFIAHLASLALQAIEQDNPSALDEALDAQRDFLSEHLLRWGPVWAKLVKQHAATDFYHGIAHLTHGAFLAAAAMLQIKMPKEVAL